MLGMENRLCIADFQKGNQAMLKARPERFLQYIKIAE